MRDGVLYPQARNIRPGFLNVRFLIQVQIPTLGISELRFKFCYSVSKFFGRVQIRSGLNSLVRFYIFEVVLIRHLPDHKTKYKSKPKPKTQLRIQILIKSKTKT